MAVTAPPIRRLITTFGLLLTAALLAGVVAVMLVHEMLSRRAHLEASLASLAAVIATNSEAAVMFNSGDEAQDLLGSLRGSPEVIRAWLFLPDGSLLARYQRPAEAGASAPDCQQPRADGQGWQLRWCSVVRYQPVVRHRTVVGTLAMEATLRPTYWALLRAVGFSLLVAGAAFAISVPLWRRVAARVADPLAALVDAALQVGRQHDFSLRSEAGGSAEVLALRNAFNQMMQQLQQRDVRLHHELGQRRLAEARLNDLAYSDPVTGLNNRHYFMEQLDLALGRDQAALIYIDLDGFKRVNDTLGHDQGDALLCQVGQRLRAQLRQTDVVCRLGGDEFAVLLENTGSAEALDGIARQLVDALSRPYGLQDQTVNHVSASIGVCSFADVARDRETLLRCADQAMYQAKQAGKRTWRRYVPAVSETGQAVPGQTPVDSTFG
ncbi:sensor domain-containing diguanylate cyclase [Ideonella oryzae]|uniref:Diguanylate cyclase n=1 Tax=Ideonella oryzae TaxID=2937441 RepID=A0ABT1BTV8_9BURK|nr:sensor domain-containing diguanylate cyclase [Ideonella oryzae]MCO5978837.1 diguanylate cyclase [Ideonella oryzae]